MPLMFGYLAMQMPAGLSIYFIVSNLIGMGIQWVTNRWLSDEKEAQPVRRPSAPKVPPTEQPEADRHGKPVYRKRGYRKK